MTPAARLMSRRELLKAVGAAAGATALAGCSGSIGEKWGFSGSSSSSRVHLTYALWDGFEQVGYQKSIDEFTRRNPHISVTIQQIPYNSYQPKITSGYISGNAPDLFWINTPYIASAISQGMLTDITDRVRADNVDLSIYYPSLVKLHERNGRLYGLPKDWDTIALYYNKKLFKKFGVTPPSELTWAPDGSGTFIPFLEKLTVDSAGRHPGQTGFDAGSITTYAIGIANDAQSGYGCYLPANGGAFLPQPYADHMVLDSAENRATLTYITRTLRDRHVQAPASELGPNADGSNAQVLFAEGRIALYQAGDWNTSALAGLGAGFDIGVLPLPTGPQGRYSVFNGLTDGINSHCPHPDEAWQLAKWLGGRESQSIMGSGGYVWPAIKSLDPLFLAAWRKKGLDLSPFLEEAHGKTIPWPVAYDMGEAITDITTALGPTFLGTRSVANGLSAAEQVANYRIKSAF